MQHNSFIDFSSKTPVKLVHVGWKKVKLAKKKKNLIYYIKGFFVAKKIRENDLFKSIWAIHIKILNKKVNEENLLVKESCLNFGQEEVTMLNTHNTWIDMYEEA